MLTHLVVVFYLHCTLHACVIESIVNRAHVTWCQKWPAEMTAPYSTYNISLQPPPPFNFSSLDEWPKWRRHFEKFHVASGLCKEDEETQVSTLLYCLGDDADDVLTSTNISERTARNTWKC